MIISLLSCIPPRIDDLERHLDAIVPQVEHSYVFIPVMPTRNNETNKIVDTSRANEIAAKYGRKVTIVRSQVDRGPVEKYAGCVTKIREDFENTQKWEDICVFIGDDDQAYCPKLVETMKVEHDKAKTKHSQAVVVCNKVVKTGLRNYLACYGGLLTDLDTIDKVATVIDELGELPKCCMFVDDIFITKVFRDVDAKQIKLNTLDEDIFVNGKSNEANETALHAETKRVLSNMRCIIASDPEVLTGWLVGLIVAIIIFILFILAIIKAMH
jgi:hypothetical protein